jgi:DNA modification methylase
MLLSDIAINLQDNITINRLHTEDQPIHGWYRFVLGYPPHLVRKYLKSFGGDPDIDWVFDPFCGTATTPVEARLNGYRTISTDANPISVLAARVKLNWNVNIRQIDCEIKKILSRSASIMSLLSLPPFLQSQPFGLFEVIPESNEDLMTVKEMIGPEAMKIIPSNFISERPLWRVLAIRHAIETSNLPKNEQNLLLLALANVIITVAGNMGFGPEVYLKKPLREDADVLGAFWTTVQGMINDLKCLDTRSSYPEAKVFRDDSRSLGTLSGQDPIGIVITSPPYPNEKDYTRSTRLESVLLGLISSKKDLRALKQNLLRSNTRNVFVDDDDDQYIQDVPSVLSIVEEIEKRRIELGKTSGFERLYHRAAGLYFGGMYRHFVSLYDRLRPGARCAYVVGDQMSYFRVHIKTAHLLADMAMKAGFSVDGIELWRTRRSTVTRLDLDENVLILRRNA